MASQKGFTILEVMIVIALLGVLSALFLPLATSLRDSFEVEVLEKEGLEIANYADQIRRSAVTTTTAGIVYPDNGSYQHTYMTVPAGTTIADFRAQVLAQLGFSASVLPEETPWGTPYTLEITADQVTVTATVPVDDVNLMHAERTVIGTNTTFTFNPRRDNEHHRIGRHGNAMMAREFLQEDAR